MDRDAVERNVHVLAPELGRSTELGPFSVEQDLAITHLFAQGANAHAMISAAVANGVPHAEVLEDHGAIADAIRALATPGGSVLLKGSRGMRMERVLELLREAYAHPETESQTKE